MAKVTQPLGSSEARGSVGLFTYNTWRGIHTVKERKAPLYTPGGAREASKNIVQFCAQRWRSITQQQRDAWDLYALTHKDCDWTGNDLRLAGYHWYVRCTSRLIRLDIPYDDNPPDLIPLPGLYLFSASYQPPYIAIAWSSDQSPHADASFVSVWAAGPLSSGRRPSIHDARFILNCGYHDEISGYPSAGAGRYTTWLAVTTEQGARTPFLRLNYVDVP